MRPPDLLRALGPVAEALEAIGARWYVGGSLASSARGVARSSLDVDVVADLRPGQEKDFVARLRSAYYVSEEAVGEAVRERSSFNLVHLETMFKVDVFVAGSRPHDREALARARPEALDEEPGSRRFPVAAAEDVVLSKLAWFRLGGERSERQWTDVLGVLSASRDLDLAYLTRHAEGLSVGDLLARALSEADRGGGGGGAPASV